MLQRAMARLRADAGCFVQMTATPSRKLLGEARARDAHLVYIPARYHGHPLPVPVICPERALAGWQQKLERGGAALLPVPLALERALADTRSEKAQLLVFVPRRAQVQPVVSALAEAGVREVKGVHSRSRTRDTVRQALASGLLEAVVATTVYERGLTFPNVNVVVLFADNMQVFDVATLVQMSGRVGRTMERPDGRVWFLCTRENRCMREAVSSIEKLNEIARERGLLYSCGAE